MGFNSTLLSSSNDNNSNYILEEVRNTESIIMSMLEMNDFMHDKNIELAVSKYRTLMEGIAITESTGKDEFIDESYVAKAWEYLVKIVEAIIKFIGKACRWLSYNADVDLRILDQQIKMSKSKLPETSWAIQNPNEVKTINVYYYPTIKTLDDIKIDKIIAELKAKLMIVLTFKRLDVSDLDEDIYKAMGKVIGDMRIPNSSNTTEADVHDSASFNLFVDNASHCMLTESMNADQWMDYYRSLSAKVTKSREFASKTKNLDKHLNEAMNKLRDSKLVVDNDTYMKASAIVGCMKHVITDYIRLVDIAVRCQQEEIRNANADFRKFMIGTVVPANEAGYIHGEEFNSETLFANEDLRDFNRTEWLDLNIEAELYEMKYELMETYGRIALMEAQIFANDDPLKYQQLVAMREAEESKAATTIQNIMTRIKELLAKFMEKLKDRVGENTAYLRKHAATIEKPITIEEAVSNGDVLAGMYRVQQGLTVYPFNYDTMKDELKDKETFFKTRILGQLKNTSNFTKRTVKWADGMSIVDYCKAYYGASMPEEKYPKCTFSTDELETNKKNIISFLQSSNYSSTAKNDLRALEVEADKMARDLPSNATVSGEKKESNTSEEKPAEEVKQEGYYSNLYNTFFTEIQLNMGDKSEVAEGEENKDNGANEASEKATAFRIYMECYKDVILAKMTASEFIVSELMQVIKAHVRKYTGPEEKEGKKPAAKQETPKQQTEPAKQ